MGQFADESDLIITAGRTPTRGNWVSVEWNGFEVRLMDSDKTPYSQAELKEMCIKCLNRLFG